MLLKALIYCLLFSLIALLPATVIAQDYNYRHYTAKDGLVGPTVYAMCQDREGFTWFCTETGVSRFDGTHFTNFTTKEGLPNNEIIQVYCDVKGRVWLMPFKYEICFYKDGVIHNRQNDSLLRKLPIDGLVTEICDTRDGLMIMDRSNIFLLSDTGVINLTRDRYMMGGMVRMQHTKSGRLLFAHSWNIMEYKDGKFLLADTLPHMNLSGVQLILDDDLKVYMPRADEVHVYSKPYNLDYSIKVPAVSRLERINDSLLCINTITGTQVFNILQRKLVTTYLPEKNVNDILIDNEGCIWLGTFNDGVYRISSDRFLNLLANGPKGQKVSTYAIEKLGRNIHVGTDVGYFRLEQQASGRYQVHDEDGIRTPVKSVAATDGLVVVSTGYSMMVKKGTAPFRQMMSNNAVKQIVIEPGANSLIVAGSNGVRRFSVGDPWGMIEGGSIYRATSVAVNGEGAYYGAPDGLHQVYRRNLRGDISEVPVRTTDTLLKSGIGDMKWGDKGILWMATDQGVVGFKDGKVVRHITVKDGLSSNAVRCLRPDGNMLWVGTDKGLNRLNTDGGSITCFAQADGLAADIINHIVIEGDTVYAATQDGISYFNKHIAGTYSRCDLRLMALQVNGQPAGLQHMPTLKYRNNNLHLEYVAISYKSDGEMNYHYRLKELDSAWKQTKQTSLDLISLPPGNYTLELYATNRFGINSALLTLPLEVKGPFWQQLWFILLAVVVLVGATWAIVQWRLGIARKKDEAERETTRQLHELEQKALRAQMNPHFIFNCLTSVQEFMLDKDMESANRYLTRFARLIRQTLDISMQSSITVQDEVRYLRTYLELEQMRFPSGFSFSITVDPAINADITGWPGMVLQPCVENAVYHGIRHLKNREGILNISFRLEGQMIVCEVTDNGIGRKEAAGKKGHGHVSWGTRITQQRIDMMNKGISSNIGITVTDLPDNAGTSVVVRFPFSTSVSN